MRQPKGMLGPSARRPEELLLLCYYEPSGVSTVPENVAFLQSFSDYSISVLNMHEHRQSLDGLELPSELNLEKFAGIILHNTVSYSVDNLRSLDRRTKVKLKEFDGVKVLMKQDENHRFRELSEYIEETQFDLICTCLPESERAKVYLLNDVQRVEFLQMLTGYVTPSLRQLKFPFEPRSVDIGYRGSIQPLSFGRLAYEKRKIGDDIIRLLGEKGLRLDISSRWEDRIGGEDWYQFLGRCKTTLGAESGASVFDLGGTLSDKCRTAEKTLGSSDDSAEYAERFLAFFDDLEGNVKYAQISPRHLEAAASGTLQWLYPGTYSGILTAGKHYVALQRDYSNLNTVLDSLKDDQLRAEITARAREEVIGNKEYWIESFVANLDRRMALLMDKKGSSKARSTKLSPSGKSNVLLICAHPPKIDPRLDWIAAHCPPPLAVHTLGVLPPDHAADSLSGSPNGAWIHASHRITYESKTWSEWYRMVGDDSAGLAALQEILVLDKLLKLSPEEFAESLGAPIRHQRLVDFRWYLKYFLDTCATLVGQADGLSGFGAVIATDLDTLLPGLIISRIKRLPLCYDAHELWSESDVRALEFEKPFWSRLEGRLLQYTQARFTVSPGLAALQQNLHGLEFGVLPNCEPAGQVAAIDRPSTPTDGQCRFLFQGGFAEGRGLRELISVWAKTDHRAVLLLRGKPNEFREQLIKHAKKNGLYNTRVFFPDAVDEKDLVDAAASSGDVGIVPYPKTNVLYANCSPNKLSQYMAAGLPVLANDTFFVGEIVRKADCGLVAKFENEEALVSAVNSLVGDKSLRRCYSNNSLQYFRKSFNWQVNAEEFYSKLVALTETKCDTLIYSVTPSEPYYFREPGEAPSNERSQCATQKQWTVAEARVQKHFAHKCRVLLRPVWHRLPSSVRDRLRSVRVVF